MADRDKSDFRILFPEGEQISFLAKVSDSLGIRDSELAALVGVHRRTFNDWRRGRFLMPLAAAREFSRRSDVPLPRQVEVRDQYWYTREGAKAGWLAVRKKYGRVPGNETYRRKRWKEWWDREGRFREHPIISVPTAVKRPRFSQRLAEFTGIMMGDGGISRFQVAVTLDREADQLYSQYVQNLLETLFDVPVTRVRRARECTVVLTVSRVELVRFCRDKLGLKVGHKLRQGLDIPEWIQKKRIYKLACVRGLMDTDGCIFNECHNIGGKQYCYPRICFSSASPALCDSVSRILRGLGLKPTLRAKRKVQLENRDDILDYFRQIGTNSPKHLARFRKFVGGVEQLAALRS